MGDAPGTFARCTVTAAPGDCPARAIGGYWQDPSFRALTTASSAHRITQVRLFVAYDAVEEYNGSPSSPGCVMSRAAQQSWTDGAGRVHAAAQSWDDLQAGLVAAHADGLQPVVSISGYGSPHATPSWDQPFPDPTTVAGWWEYRCGVEGVLNAVNRLPADERPHIWEAVNEPDSFSVFKGNEDSVGRSCAVVPVSDLSGPGKAACAYLLGGWEIRRFAGHGADTVIAGVFTHPDDLYLKAYAALLAAQVPGARYPAVWGIHDYDDVTAAYRGGAPGTSNLHDFDLALAADSGGGAQELWVTETGTLLTLSVAGFDCPAAGVDGAGTLGACVNGRRDRQEADVAGFFGLADAGGSAGAGGVPVTHLFWYQWAGESNWDSGLSDGTGQLRAPWCALLRVGRLHGQPVRGFSPGLTRQRWLARSAQLVCRPVTSAWMAALSGAATPARAASRTIPPLSISISVGRWARTSWSMLGLWW